MATYDSLPSPQEWDTNGRPHKEAPREAEKDRETSRDKEKAQKDRERRDREQKDREGKEHGHKNEDSRSKGDRHSREHGNDRHRSKDRRHKSRDRSKERERSRDRDGDRDRDRDRDRERKSRDRSRERERRHHEYDSDREHRHKRSTRSRSSGRSRDRSRSRGRSRDHGRSRSRSGSRDEKSKRTSGFDMAPPGVPVVPGMTLSGQLPGVAQALPTVLPGFPFGGGQIAALSAMPMQAMTQQAMKHARRVYVGGLPPMANEQTIAAFFNQVMQIIGGNSAPGDAVVNVYINHEKKFAFVEMRTVEEASNAMALDGIMFEGMPLRVRRPSDYNPSLAITLGPSQPNPHLNLGAVGLTPGIIGGADGPDKIFVGGLPYYLTEAQIKELLESFGPLRGFDLVKDRETGNSKGYAFCVYQDTAVTDVACAALNGLKMGDKTLTVRRATAGGQPKPDQENVLLQAQQQIAMQKLAWQAGAAYNLIAGLPTGVSGTGSPLTETPTKVLCLTQLVSVDELRDDKEFEDIYQDVQDECSKYGDVANLVIPRPSLTGDIVPGLGKAFVEYVDVQGSSKARAALNGRKFAGNTVLAVYYPEDKFARGELDS